MANDVSHLRTLVKKTNIPKDSNQFGVAIKSVVSSLYFER